MTLTTFLRKCKEGDTIIHKPTKREGTVIKFSKGHDKALVRYENGSVEWNEYYLIDFETSNS
jgi:hypothetical protein